MENVLDVYQRPYDKNMPVICMDEQPVQLLDQVREPLPARAGSVRKEDYEYERKGTCSVFVFTEPLTGWRRTQALQQRTMVEWAHQIQHLCDVDFPDAAKIVLVMDNLNTHKTGALYEAFPPEEAHRLAQRLEIHYTPVHGSWLNIAENELSAMTRQCLKRRIGDIQTLDSELTAWQNDTNACAQPVRWQFTTADARTRLYRLYPVASTTPQTTK
jgi:hypothetical protein